MKKFTLITVFNFLSIICFAVIPPHLYNHTFPYINSQDERVNVMLNQVSSENIENYVGSLTSFINRRCDSHNIYNVKDWLVETYNDFGLDSIILHDFEVIPFWDSVPRPFTTAPNVIAVQLGKTKPNEIIICGAHYDSWVKVDEPYDPDTIVSPGADDNASGVAGILETARILSNYDFERTIIYANWNAEEVGLCGSHAYAHDCAADSVDIVAYFNLDMTGYVNPGDDIHIHLLYATCDSLLGDFVKQVNNTYFPGINITHAWLTSGGDTDYSSFNRHGYQAISPSEDVHYLSPYIHSVNDIVGLSLNNWDQAVLFTKLNLASVALSAGIFSESVNEVDYFDEEIVRYEVFDIFGTMVYSENNVWKNMEEIRVTNLESKFYIIRFFTKSGKSFSKKFFVKY